MRPIPTPPNGQDDTFTILLFVTFGALLVLIFLAVGLSKLFVTAEYGQVLIVTGPRDDVARGRVVEGMSVRFPPLRRVHVMDLERPPFHARADGVPSSDGVQLDVEGEAHVEVRHKIDAMRAAVPIVNAPERWAAVVEAPIVAACAAAVADRSAAQVDADRDEVGRDVTKAVRDELREHGLLLTRFDVVQVAAEDAARPVEHTQRPTERRPDQP